MSGTYVLRVALVGKDVIEGLHPIIPSVPSRFFEGVDCRIGNVASPNKRSITDIPNTYEEVIVLIGRSGNPTLKDSTFENRGYGEDRYQNYMTINGTVNK